MTAGAIDSDRATGAPVPREWLEEFEAARRVKDLESLPRLSAFREYWLERRRQS